MDSRIKICHQDIEGLPDNHVSILVLMDSRIKIPYRINPGPSMYRFNPCFNG